jgi:cell division protein FtsB
MKLDWGMLGPGAARAAAAAAVLILGGLLAAQAAEARKERVALERRHAAADRELERARRRSQSMKDELRALEQDPAYVESLLRRWNRAAPSEKIVE